MEEMAPMCGIPFHSSQNYISKLVENGYKVAICEQVEDVNASKGIVKRDVVRVITPGTVLEGSLLENKKNNYLLAVYTKDNKIGISYTDISTGEVNSTHLNEDKLVEEIAKIHPTEIIANDIKTLDKIRTIASLSNIYINENFDESYLDSKILTEYFEKDYLSSLKLDDSELISSSLCIILNYIYNTQKQVT